MGELTVGIDIGTTSVKAVAAAADGTIVARTRIPHDLHAPDADTFEHDASTAWIDGVLAAWDAVGENRDVAAVTVSAMVPSLCGVDDRGHPVTPGLLYGDHRGRSEQPDTGGGGVEGEVVGFCRALSAAPGVAALWPAQAVANHALCGVGAIDTSTAMTMAPLFTGSGWDPELIAELGLTDERLPAFIPGTTAIGDRNGVAVSGGTIDALAEQTVADATESGDVMVICGTTLIPWALTTEWIEVDGLWTIPYSVPGLIAIGGASNAGGLFIDHVRRLTGDPSPADVLAVAPDRRPVWVPYIRGERTPFHDPGRRAQLLDLRVGHDAAATLAAAYDAAAFVVRHHLDLAAAELTASAATPTRIVAAGGGTRSSAWMQALADGTGLPVDVTAQPEGAALGAAFTSRLTAGLQADPMPSRSWRRTSHRVEPRADHVDAATTRYIRFREAVDQ
ncbi:MAG: FGGY-family carbohydrate kinase [Acidimicrobiales bacterium]